MQEIFNALFNAQNPYFSAGFGLMGVGVLLGAARSSAYKAASLLQQRYMTTLEVTSKDVAYHWILGWLEKQTLQSGNHFSLNAGSAKGSFSLRPSTGTHYLRWSGVWLRVCRERERGGGALMDLTSGMPFETIKFSTLGRRPNLLKTLIKQACDAQIKKEQGKLVIYNSWAAEWRPFGPPRRKRSLSSLIFDGDIKERLLENIHEFLSSSRWYEDRGIPYRRGYLLYGPPGGGKSSLVQAIASHLDYSICIMNLSDAIISDDRLSHLLNVLPPKSILLLEDIDCAQSNRDGKLSLSGLLNSLDGVACGEGERLVFMTTNHRHLLDPALIRPGRIDYQQYIGDCSDLQLLRMFIRFYPETSSEKSESRLAEKFVSVLSAGDGCALSPARIQGHFIEHKDSPMDAVKNAYKLRNDDLPEGLDVQPQTLKIPSKTTIDKTICMKR